MNFGELVERVRAWRASNSLTEASADLTYIKDTINAVYREVLSVAGFVWQSKEAVMDLEPSWSDGTLVATNGASIMTLTNTLTHTGFTHQHWGSKVQMGDDSMFYTLERTSIGTEDPHYAYLDRPYQGVSTVSLSYTIYMDTYPLPGDFRKMDNCRLAGSSGGVLMPLSPHDLDRRTVHPLREAPTGDPTYYSVWQRRNESWFQTTCTVTNGSAFVDLEEYGWAHGISNWRDRCVQFSDGDRYRVRRQNNSSPGEVVQLELDRSFGGVSATETAILIDPRGMNLVQFWPVPTSANTMIMKYIGSDHDLVNDADVPTVPADHHDTIWKGAIYHLAQFDRSLAPEQLDRVFRDFMAAKGRLDSYQSMNEDTRFQRRAWGESRYQTGLRLPRTWTTT